MQEGEESIGSFRFSRCELRADESLEFPPGLVWLIGAGPGDPGLLTLHALSAIRRADAVVFDALVNQRILDWCAGGAQKIYSGKRGGKPSPKQRDISLELIRLSREGLRVARLKGGDPFVFGRGGEEAMTLVRAGIPVRITPGISAGVGGLAYAGIPLTHRDVNQCVTFLTGHDQSGGAPGAIDWEALARGSQVIVLYMAMKNLSLIASRLIEGGRSSEEPTIVVSNATLPEQVSLESTLGRVATDVRNYGLNAPAIVCIGHNVALRRKIMEGVIHDMSTTHIDASLRVEST